MQAAILRRGSARPNVRDMDTLLAGRREITRKCAAQDLPIRRLHRFFALVYQARAHVITMGSCELPTPPLLVEDVCADACVPASLPSALSLS